MPAPPCGYGARKNAGQVVNFDGGARDSLVFSHDGELFIYGPSD